ncbi:MAG: DUF1549 domain-containing protein [Pirellulaceae bacterium]
MRVDMRCRIVLLLGILTQLSPLAAQEASLHDRIDQQLALVQLVPSAVCSDAEFLRRVSLDLTGMPPTADAARAFLDDPNPDKRTVLVDALFASPQYARHQASMLDLMLMERRANTHVPADAWQAWLLASVRANKPWNVLVRELLTADGVDAATRPAARFLLDRGVEPHLLTRDIGRIFFGRDLQCAQCHDHPLVDDYLQADYHGLLACISPSRPQAIKEGETTQTVVAEKAGSELAFESVFLKNPHRTGPRLPAAVAFDEPVLLPGEDYKVAPADNVKEVPTFSRRQRLAELATDGGNQAFNENIVNRLWAQMFGRGLVHPVDWHHADNPAIDPELLKILANAFVQMNFDMKAFLRELALSKAYQRPFDLPQEEASLSTAASATVGPLEKELVDLRAIASQSSDAFSSATDAWYAAEAVALPVAAEVDAAKAAVAEAAKKLNEANAALQVAQTNVQTKQQLAATLATAVDAAQKAAALLPEDASVADAVAKLLAKSQAVAAEVPPLVKAAEDATAVVTASTTTLATAKETFNTTIAKHAPLKQAIIAAEQAMLVARQQMTADKGAVAAIDRRLETAKLVSNIPTFDQQILEADGVAQQAEQQSVASQASLDEYAPVFAAAQSNVAAAKQALQQAEAKRMTAVAEHEKQKMQVVLISETSAAAKRSLDAIPGDAVLTEVLAKLQQRSADAETIVGQGQAAVDTASQAMTAASDAVVQAENALAEAATQLQQRQQAVEKAKADLATAQAVANQKRQQRSDLTTQLNARWVNDFTASSIKPLTPEQMCWSVFRVTGVYQNYWNAEVAELEKTAPPTDAQKSDPAFQATRQTDLEQRVYDKLKGNVGLFVSFYGAAAGQPQSDFFATADQALFAANGGPINSWVGPSGDNVTQRMIQQTDLGLAADDLYLGVLSRLPSAEERREVIDHLTPRTEDKAVAVKELVWAVLNSSEFRFNH